MAKIKYDGVIEAVHYQPEGQVAWVRAYQRRGPTFSDHLLIQRQELIEQLKAGKNFRVGERKPYLAGTFEVGEAVRLVQHEGRELLVVGEQQGDQDQLKGVPIL